jgi:hypothetical protein
MNSTKLRNLVLLLCIFAVGTVRSFGAEDQRRALEQQLTQTLDSFEVKQVTLMQGLKILTKSMSPPPSFGVETVLRDKFADLSAIDPRFDLTLKNKSVGAILDALCSADGRYKWSQDGGTINIYPRAIEDQGDYLLNRALSEVDFKAITNVEMGLLSIVRQLPGPEEQIAHAQTGGDSSFPPQPWTANFRDVTVRQAINRLVEHMGASTCWIFHGSHDFRAFALFRSGLPQQ